MKIVYLVLVLVVVVVAAIAAVWLDYGTMTPSSTHTSAGTVSSVLSSSTTSSRTNQTFLAVGNPNDCNLSASEFMANYGSIPASIQNALNPLYECQSRSHPNYMIYPLTQMNPGSTAEIRALYLINSPWTLTNSSYPQVYRLPYLSAPNATLLEIGFNLSSSFTITNATVLFKSNSTIEYQYSIRSLPNSTGYYELILPSSCGWLQIALAVGINSSSLSANYLDELGYDGTFMCAGPSVPGLVVGVTNMNVTYVMIPRYGS